MSKAILDYILENSDTEDNYKQSIHNYAKSKLGSGDIESIKALSSDEESYINNLKNKLIEPKETLESKYLEKKVYPALQSVTETADVLGTLPQAVIAPAGYLANTASNLIQGKELETEPVIYEKPYEWIKKYGTIGALSRTIDTPNLDKPISDIIPQTETGDFLKQEFPKAYQNIAGTTYKDIANIAGDIPLLNAGVSGASKLAQTDMMQNIAQKSSEYMRQKSLPHIEKALIRLSEENKDKLPQMERSGKFKSMAKTLSEYNLAKDITNPVALYENTKKLIPDFASSVKDEASMIKIPFNADELKGKVLDNMSSKFGKKTSAVKYDPLVVAQDLEEILPSGNLTLKELVELKSNVGDYVFDLKSRIPTDEVLGATKKALYEEIWKQIDNDINAKVGSESNFVKLNKKLSDLIEVRNQLDSAKIEKLKTPSLVDMAVGTGTGALGATALGVNPLFGAAVYPTMRYGVKGVEYGVPALAGKSLDTISNALYSPIEKGIPFEHSPMAKGAIMSGAMTNRLLNEYKLPRSHEEFIAELPMVQKKLSSVMGEDAANQAISQLQSSPQEFYDKLPLIENQLPGLFKYDRYRRVNGRIFDPTLKALAEKEILNSPMSNSEKMMKQSMLLKNGLYDGI